MLGINEVLCTEIAGSKDYWDGALRRENCKGEVKVKRLVEYLGVSTRLSGSWAYADSPSDLPVLRWVENGVLVQPDWLALISEKTLLTTDGIRHRALNTLIGETACR
jgi:phosphoserine phosphatase